MIQRQKDSGLTQAEFCKREGVSQNSFSFWKGEIAKRDSQALKASPSITDASFVPLNLCRAETTSDRPIAEIDLHTGVVRIFSGVDRHALHEIIAALKEATK
jgi:hypothetical protein